VKIGPMQEPGTGGGRRVTAAAEPPARVEPPRSRRVYLLVAIALTVVAAAAVFIASSADPSDLATRADVSNLPVGPKLPGLDAAVGWINSDPISKADLRNKVVVYDFWTYSCVNCVRTLPHLEAWYDRYADDGLVIVGVHSPEFEFEKDHGNVRDAVRRLRVNYPVALDDNMAIWNQFSNQYWPAKYITDRRGHLRYLHFGEGSYGETEDVIRKLLGIPKSAPFAESVEDDSEQNAQVATITPETYLGTLRGAAAQPGEVTYPVGSGAPELDEVRLEGTWDAGDEQVTSDAEGSAIVLRYRAAEVNLVLGPQSGTPVDLVVEIDGRPLKESERTAQTMIDANGNTFVRVTAYDLYRLVLSPSVEEHTIRLVARGPGLQAFAFTFGT
jgi:thiol-disulfide isomerase/thioredoxin